MWGLSRDSRQLDFIPDKDDRSARAKAARSLTAVSTAATSDRNSNQDDRRPPGGRPSSVVENKVELPWSSYLGQKRERERQKQKERDGRRTSSWPPNGGAGWMPFWRERFIGGTELAMRLSGPRGAQVMSISTSSHSRAPNTARPQSTSQLSRN